MEGVYKIGKREYQQEYSIDKYHIVKELKGNNRFGIRTFYDDNKMKQQQIKINIIDN